MGVTKSQLYAFGALGLAVASLGFDRFVLSASATVEAPVSDREAAIDADPDESSAEIAVDRGMTLAAHFDKFYAASSDVGNAFGRPAQQAVETPARPNGATVVETPVGARLSAILSRGDGRIAVISGRPLRVGDSAAGVTVLSISDRSVVVDTQTGPIMLELDSPTLGRD
ncbi:MAG: hypothetical protein AAFR96_08755 [Planctomycetota bacterium]